MMMKILLSFFVLLIMGCCNSTPNIEKVRVVNVYTKQKLNFPEELLKLKNLPKSPIIKDDDSYKVISIKLANYINKLGADDYYLRVKLKLIKKWVDKRKKKEESGS